MKEPEWIVGFPLTHAYLCMNCNCVVNRSWKCPVCESHSLIGLQKILDRPSPPEEVNA